MVSTLSSPTWRFAPSPTGPLHFGSLVAALASFLDARAHGGRWLLRMEDLDPPREEPGAAARILRSLEAHGLQWDGEVLYQSQRDQAYAAALDQLRTRGSLYACHCSRKQVMDAGGIYPGTCRRAGLAEHGAALRVHATGIIDFDDLFFGPQRQDVASSGDFIVRRRDGLFAYLLAVAVDDAFQGITHVVRGSDLLDCTGQQIFLLRELNAAVPRYGHVPVVIDAEGQKLSKQNRAPALDDTAAGGNLRRALCFLGHPPPADMHGVTGLLEWAVVSWRRERVPAVPGMPEVPCMKEASR